MRLLKYCLTETRLSGLKKENKSVLEIDMRRKIGEL